MTVRVFASATEPGPLALSPEESHYLVRVRRARVGAEVEVLDPQAGGWSAKLELADAKLARVVVQAPLTPRPPLPIDLAVALPDTKAAYELVSRAVESGARRLTFIETERSQPGRLNPDRLDRVIAAARRQCGRLDRMAVDHPTPLRTWLGEPRRGYVASLAPTAATDPLHGELVVLIGPEGGLSGDEERLALDAGLRPLRLGPFVLRTEVAVTAALAVAGTISAV